MRSTSRVAHGKAPVTLGGVRMTEPKPPMKKDISRFTRASPVWVKNQHRLLNERVERVREEFESSPLNRLDLKRGTRLGVVAAGPP